MRGLFDWFLVVLKISFQTESNNNPFSLEAFIYETGFKSIFLSEWIMHFKRVCYI